jgi:hypothetical protein
MSHNDDDDQLGADDPETSAKKSERKRQREKQRRRDLAGAFTELAALLTDDDPSVNEDPANRRRRRPVDTSEGADGEIAGMTRLDLIGRTIETLRRLQQENSELKQAVDHLRRSNPNSDEHKVRILHLLIFVLFISKCVSLLFML